MRYETLLIVLNLSPEVISLVSAGIDIEIFDKLKVIDFLVIFKRLFCEPKWFVLVGAILHHLVQISNVLLDT